MSVLNKLELFIKKLVWEKKRCSKKLFDWVLTKFNFLVTYYEPLILFSKTLPFFLVFSSILYRVKLFRNKGGFQEFIGQISYIEYHLYCCWNSKSWSIWSGKNACDSSGNYMFECSHILHILYRSFRRYKINYVRRNIWHRLYLTC